MALRSLIDTPITFDSGSTRLSSSPTVLASSRRGEDPARLPDPPTKLVVSSLTLVTRVPVARSNHSLPMIPLADGVALTQGDIRELQLAKGAMAAGLRMLAGGGVDKLCLAGAFGNYIRQASARAIGLLPASLPVEPVGNSALRGARTLLLAPSAREARLRKIAALARHVELAQDPDFPYIFAEMMALASSDFAIVK